VSRQATEALRITAAELIRLEVMDEVIPEPLGGAHADPVAAFPAIKDAIMGTFRHYEHMTEREIQLDRCVRVQHIACIIMAELLYRLLSVC
jgi:acetyl-CoA carboxylase carboxyl transferase subunit alpha